MIPEAAVDAAFAALFPKEPTPSAFKSAVWEPTIKTILEAAAPHMRPDFRESNLKAIADEIANPLKLSDWERCPKRHASQVQHLLDCEGDTAHGND